MSRVLLTDSVEWLCEALHLLRAALRFGCSSRIETHADYRPLPVDFTLNLNGKRLARGLGHTAITVPRLSDTVVLVQTSTSTFDVVRQLLSFSQAQDLSYDITDRLHLKDGRLSFDNSGILLEKGQFSGAPFP